MADSDLNSLINNLARKSDSEMLKRNGGPIAAPDRVGTSDPSYVGGFVKSTAGAAVETMGAPPSMSNEQFRQENPVGGMISQLVGTAVPYAGYVAGSHKVPPLNNLIMKAEEAVTSPIGKGIVGNTLRMAPMEAARLAGTAVMNPNALEDAAGGAAINLAVEAALGGVSGLLKAGGRVAPEAEKAALEMSDLKEAPQTQIGMLKEKLANGQFSPELTPRVSAKIKELESQIRMETVSLVDKETGETRVLRKAIGDLEQGESQPLNRLFTDNNSEGGSIRRSRLAVVGGGFKDKNEVKRVVDAAGLDGKWEDISLPRYVGFGKGSKKHPADIEKAMVDRALMTQVDDRTLMNKEKDGLYVMSRKISGTIGQHADTDEWVVWKTSKPGLFAKDIQEFVDKQTARMSFRRENVNPSGNPLLKIVDDSAMKISQMPMTNYLKGQQKGLFDGAWDKARKAFGLPEAQEGSSFLATRAKNWFDTYLTPNQYQWTPSPRAKWIMAHARDINDKYLKQADEILFGTAKAGTGSAIKRVLTDPETTGRVNGRSALQPIIDKMSKEDISSAIRASEHLAEVAEDLDDVAQHIDGLLASGDINQSVADFLHNANAHDKEIMAQMQALDELVGKNPFKPLAGHVMLSRTWEGDYRAILTNEAGDKVYVAGGKSPTAADTKAKAIIAEAEKSGITGLKLTPAEAFDAARDIELGQQIRHKSDQFKTLSRISRDLAREPSKALTLSKERTGMGGFQTEFSNKEFLDKMRNHLNERHKYMSKVTRQYLLGQDMQKLLESDPKTMQSLLLRLQDLDGEQGLFGQLQNRGVDKILGPALGGRNSASKIVDTLNEYQYHMNFGAFNLAFPAINALTFVQTVAPEIAFLANATDNAITNKYYGSMLALGTDRRPRGLFGFLDPAKLTVQGMKELSKPGTLTEKLLDRALFDGVIDPKLTAEFMGDTAKFKTTLKDVMSGKDGWVNLIKTVSTYLPEKSERLARAHAFVTGRLVAEEILGLKDPEQIYRLAKQFTQRTMYGYQTVDRPQIFTSPLGRTFGLFKNWQAHYIATMAQYAGEFNQGNFAPLLWQMGGTGAVGGLVGTPLYGVADAASKLMTDKTLMQNYYQAFGNSDPNSPMGNVHDAVFWGLPSFLGLTLSGNVSAPGADPARDAAGLMSFPQWQRAVDLAGAVGNAIDTWSVTGKHPAGSSDVLEKFALATLPKTLNRYISSTTNDIVSLRSGKIQADGLSDYELIMYKLGFTPKRLGINQRVERELWNDQNKLRTQITTMGRVWMEAQQNSDYDGMMALTRQAILKGLPIESIIKSANTQNQKRQKEMLNTQFDPLKVQPYRDLGLVE